MRYNMEYITIHPLENGDKLTRFEFEKRYELMNQQTKAELQKSLKSENHQNFINN